MRTINPIRKALVKQSYLQTGGNGYKALKAGGCKESFARHSVSSKNTLLNVVKREIQQDINKARLAERSYQTLQDNLEADKASDRNTAAIAILDFVEGKKSSVDNKGAEKLVIIDRSNTVKPLDTTELT